MGVFLLSALDTRTAIVYNGAMKTYIVYVNGVAAGMIKAGSHNAAEKKAQAKFPDQSVSVEYTEV
jgi:hypothetical protein